MAAIPIEYASPELTRRYRTLLGLAGLCGGLPLGVGVVTFLFWLATRAEECMLVGFFTIACGLVLFAVGIIALIIHSVLNWHFLTRDPARSSYRRRLALVALLLVSNFPVCYCIVMIVAAIAK
jgi:hypothetical protein